jgi:hypothetical protein
MIDYTTINIFMKSRDLVYYNGSVQIHISINSEFNICYIYVHDVFNEKLTMRYFTDISEALSWIDTL